MKVYLKPPRVASPSLARVASALELYAPKGITIVDRKRDADLVILHAIGRQDQILKEASEVNDYAVIQYAVRSTLRPTTEGWWPLWRDARAVWSYYDLQMLMDQDNVRAVLDFYHAPLGVSDAFSRKSDAKKYMIATTGQSYLTESVRECHLAAMHLGWPVFHLGEEQEQTMMTCRTGVSDGELAELYAQCRYVSGLRRIEGFELPAAEGLICGARPILFDRPHYRQWFEEFAIFIPETPREQTIEDLKAVFAQTYKPVTDQEIALARKRFNWKKITKGFWERLI